LLLRLLRALLRCQGGGLGLGLLLHSLMRQHLLGLLRGLHHVLLTHGLGLHRLCLCLLRRELSLHGAWDAVSAEAGARRQNPPARGSNLTSGPSLPPTYTQSYAVLYSNEPSSERGAVHSQEHPPGFPPLRLSFVASPRRILVVERCWATVFFFFSVFLDNRARDRTR
jgi:hypothetical protein